MHELTLATSILDSVAQETRHLPAARVRRVGVWIGCFSGFDAESLAFCLEAVSRDGTLNQATFDVVTGDREFLCPDCGRRPCHDRDAADGPCLGCGRPVAVVAAQEVFLEEIELDDEEDGSEQED